MSRSLVALSLLCCLGCSGGADKAAGDSAAAGDGGTTSPTDDTTDDTDDPADTADTADTGEPAVDADGDGFGPDVDCDDTDPAVHPGAVEVPGDGIDNDCDPDTCAGSGASGPASPLTLPTGYGARTFASPGNGGDCEGERPRWTLVDITGDGVRDIVVVRSPCADTDPGVTTWTVHAGEAGGFSAAIAWTLPTDVPEGQLRAPGNPGGCDETGRPRWALRDLTGDARPDIVFTQSCEDGTDIGTARWRVFENTGSGFSTGADFALPGGFPDGALDDFSSFSECGEARPSYSLMDLDHDGDEDLVVTSSACLDDDPGITRWDLYENSGTGFAASSTAFALPGTYPVGTFASPGNGGSCADGVPRWTARDLDGDGFLDAVVTWIDCDDPVVGTTEWLVHAGSATGFAHAPTTWTLPTGYGEGAFEAVAGDLECPRERPRFELEELDGDGRLELLILRSPCEDDDVGTARWKVHRSTGTAFSDTADDWLLPAGYGAETFHRVGAVRECSPEIPGWSLSDVDQDGFKDVLVTASACLDDTVGDTEWAVHAGGCAL